MKKEPIYAFPNLHINGDYSRSMMGGMLLRDWFAGMILSGIYARGVSRYSDGNMGAQADEYIAKGVYEQADAMLQARGEK